MSSEDQSKETETITLEVRPAWLETATLRGIPVEWMVNQYVGLTCSKVLRRAKAKADQEAQRDNA